MHNQIVYFQRANAALSTSYPQYKSKLEDMVKLKEAPQVSELAVLKPEEFKQRKQLEGYITVEGPVCSARLFLW